MATLACRSLAVVFEVTSEMADRAFPLTGSTICGSNFVTSSFLPPNEYPARPKMEGINRIKRESVNGFILNWKQDLWPEIVITPKVPEYSITNHLFFLLF
jgi:hypothetical protein